MTVRPMRSTEVRRQPSFDQFAKFGEVREPTESEAPILVPALRQAVHHWLYELNCEKDLAAVQVKPRQRVLLAGPPGTGKTTLAWHVAARLGVPLLVIETPSLVSSYVGRTGEQIGALFATARAMPGEIALFFDELDALASTRNDASSSAGQEKNSIIIALMQMIDRYEGLLFAATNRPDSIDPAIWRRFQMQMTVGLPGPDERFAIIKRYLTPFQLADEDIEGLAEVLRDASPALIREVVESVKRDLVIGPRIGHALEAADVFGRIRVATAPAEDMAQPPLWSAPDRAAKLLAGISWPPVRP